MPLRRVRDRGAHGVLGHTHCPRRHALLGLSRRTLPGATRCLTAGSRARSPRYTALPPVSRSWNDRDVPTTSPAAALQRRAGRHDQTAFKGPRSSPRTADAAPESRPAKPDQALAAREVVSSPTAAASVNFAAAGLLDGVEGRARAARERLLRELHPRARRGDAGRAVLGGEALEAVTPSLSRRHQAGPVRRGCNRKRGSS